MQILIAGLDVYAYHGVPDAEREVGHRYRVDLTLEVSETASETDDIHGSVDYAKAAALTAEIMRTHQYRTLERLAKVIAEALLEHFIRIEQVTVKVAKPLPPAPIPVESVGVRFVLRRG